MFEAGWNEGRAVGWRSLIREEQTCLKGITAAGSRYLPAGVAVQGLIRAPMQPDRSAVEAARMGWPRAWKPGSSPPQRVLLAQVQAPLVAGALGPPLANAAGEGPLV